MPGFVCGDPKHAQPEFVGDLTSTFRPQNHEGSRIAVGKGTAGVDDRHGRQGMRAGMSAAWIDEVAVGLAIACQAVAVVATGGDAEIRQRQSFEGIPGWGFGRLDADTPGCACGRMAKGGDLTADLEDKVGQALLLKSRNQFVDDETFGDAGDVDAQIGEVLF